MKMRAELLGTCAVSALVIGLGFASPVLAADVMPMKAPPLAAPLWWYEGFAEIGGRFDMNSPDKSTLGKFYTYRDLRPGVFGNFFFGAHRTVDPFDIEVWGKNVGWEDQAYGLDVTKPGSYYLTFGWDETPHDYWQNAKTLYTGIGGNVLTVPASVRGALNNSIGANGLPTAASNTIINNNSSTIDLRYRRDTANAAARWTPTDNWDFNADYTHIHREGAEAMGAVSFSPAAATSTASGATRSTFELPRPIDDTTQNANLKGEYAGSTPWGKPFNVALGGGLSRYSDSFNSLTFQNPWNVDTVSPALQGLRPVNNLYSLPPDNQAANVSLQGGVGLPFNSRYMGTFQYTKMTSDQSNLPFSINPGVLALNTQFSAPSRETNTLLFNNVLHTQLTSDLQSTLKYRYYNYKPEDNPAIIFGPRPQNPEFDAWFPGRRGRHSPPSPMDQAERRCPDRLPSLEMAECRSELRLGALGLHRPPSQ